MPRKGPAEKRHIMPDPIYRSLLVSQITNKVMLHGKRKGHSYSMDPDTVAQVIERSAVDHTCPVGGTEVYTDEGRPADWNALCTGTTADNSLYGEGIVNAVTATSGRKP